MTKLDKKLASWVENNFISGEQKDKILEYEKNLLQNQKSNKVLYTFVSLGVSIIGIGIISLIAANWAEIPGIVKIVIDFILLCSISTYLVLKRETMKPLYFEAWLIFLTFFNLASIGLIAQVYHTGGELYQALSFWLIIILPITLLSQKKLLPHLWVFSFLMTALFWVFSGHSVWKYWEKDETLLTFFVFLPFFCFFVALLLEKLSKQFQFSRPLDFSKPFQIWALLSALGMIVMSDILFSVGFYQHLSIQSFLPFSICFAAIIPLLFFNEEYSKKEKFLLLSLGIITFLFYLPYPFISPDNPHTFYHENNLIGSIFTILTLFIFSLFFSLREMPRLFNLSIILIGVRFLIIYFQVIGSLLFTGIGLILSGLIIVGLAILWYKNRKKIEIFFNRVLK